MELGLSGLKAVVTGASKGLGFATALQLLQEGARVAINSRSRDHLKDACNTLIAAKIPQEKFFSIASDVTDTSSCKDLINRSSKELGGIDILITNSGGPPPGCFDQMTELDWEKAIDLSFLSHLNLIKYALPFLEKSKHPSVLAITSISVKYPLDNLILSNTVRAATAALIKSLSIELGNKGIRFNSVLPGWTLTDRVNQLLASRADLNNSTVLTEQDKISSAIPLGRMGKPEEFAKAAVFLVSPAASYITGVMLPVDGGITRALF